MALKILRYIGASVFGFMFIASLLLLPGSAIALLTTALGFVIILPESGWYIQTKVVKVPDWLRICSVVGLLFLSVGFMSRGESLMSRMNRFSVVQDSLKRDAIRKDSIWLSSLSPRQKDSIQQARKDSAHAQKMRRWALAEKKDRENRIKKLEKKAKRHSGMIQSMVKMYLKDDYLLDGDSYGDLGWRDLTVHDRDDYCFSVIHQFKARNGFGGYSSSTMVFYLNEEYEVVKTLKL